jgi:hypothetical protein
MIQMGFDTYKKVKQKIKIENIEHFLKLYQESSNNESEYIKIIKAYLLSSEHHHKKSSSVATEYYEPSTGTRIFFIIILGLQNYSF